MSLTTHTYRPPLRPGAYRQMYRLLAEQPRQQTSRARDQLDAALAPLEAEAIRRDAVERFGDTPERQHLRRALLDAATRPREGAA